MTYGCESCHVEWSHMDGTNCWLCFELGVEWGDVHLPWNSQSAMSPFRKLNGDEERYEQAEGAPSFLVATPTDIQPKGRK